MAEQSGIGDSMTQHGRGWGLVEMKAREWGLAVTIHLFEWMCSSAPAWVMAGVRWIRRRPLLTRKT